VEYSSIAEHCLFHYLEKSQNMKAFSITLHPQFLRTLLWNAAMNSLAPHHLLSLLPFSREYLTILEAKKVHFWAVALEEEDEDDG